MLWPDWLKREPKRIWCSDVTCFPRARRAASAIVDVVSLRWIDTLVSIEETSTQVRVIFDRAPAAEGLAELITPEGVEQFAEDPTRPRSTLSWHTRPCRSARQSIRCHKGLVWSAKTDAELPGAPMSEAVVHVYEAKTNLSKLLDRVEKGKEILLGRSAAPSLGWSPIAGGESRGCPAGSQAGSTKPPTRPNG